MDRVQGQWLKSKSPLKPPEKFRVTKKNFSHICYSVSAETVVVAVVCSLLPIFPWILSGPRAGICRQKNRRHWRAQSLVYERGRGSAKQIEGAPLRLGEVARTPVSSWRGFLGAPGGKPLGFGSRLFVSRQRKLSVVFPFLILVVVLRLWRKHLQTSQGKFSQFFEKSGELWFLSGRKSRN